MNLQWRQRWRAHVWVALAWAWCTLAWAGAIEPIQITLAPDVQAALQRADLTQKKRLENAIQVGDAFIRQYLDGSAYSFDPGYADWSKHTGPLMAMSGEQFERMFDEWANKPAFDINDDKYPPRSVGVWLVCPAVPLAMADITGDKTMLTYRAQKIGYVVSSVHVPGEVGFVTARDGGVHEIRLTLEPTHLISMIQLSELTAPMDYRLAILGMNNFVRKPFFRIGDTKEAVQAAVVRGHQIIRDIDRAAANSCPTISASNTTRKEK